jgi:multidrug transporter EmrE-like cation transporter
MSFEVIDKCKEELNIIIIMLLGFSFCCIQDSYKNRKTAMAFSIMSTVGLVLLIAFAPIVGSHPAGMAVHGAATGVAGRATAAAGAGIMAGGLFFETKQILLS